MTKRRAVHPDRRPDGRVVVPAPRPSPDVRWAQALAATNELCAWQHAGVRCVAGAVDVIDGPDPTGARTGRADRPMCARHIPYALAAGGVRLR
jgi:hypothetical protein